MVEISDDGQVLDSEALHKRGMAGVGEMIRGLMFGRDPNSPGRAALRDLVEAFMLDRKGQSELFTSAHRIGELLSKLVGCPFEYDASSQIYRRDCPVLKLHAVVGNSIAWHWETCCSICGAGLFGCDHVPGECYDGEFCAQENVRLLSIDHVALTADPDFVYTWIVDNKVSASQLLDDGLITEPGETIFCTHCQECPGKPNDGDLNPVSRWQEIVEERRPVAC